MPQGERRMPRPQQHRITGLSSLVREQPGPWAGGRCHHGAPSSAGIGAPAARSVHPQLPSTGSPFSPPFSAVFSPWTPGSRCPRFCFFSIEFRKRLDSEDSFDYVGSSSSWTWSSSERDLRQDDTFPWIPLLSLPC